MARNDAMFEVGSTRATAARARAQAVLLARLEDDAVEAISGSFKSRKDTKVLRIGSPSELGAVEATREFKGEPVIWGRDRIGVGLLKALQTGSRITFEDKPSPAGSVTGKTTHLVVCEAGHDMAQVVAANYAYSLKAGLHLIPDIPEKEVEELLEELYSAINNRDRPTEEILGSVRDRMLDRLGPMPVPSGGSVTFFTNGLPFGFAYDEHPSTHLFCYPRVGTAVVNGFSAEQSGALGAGIIGLIDPHEDASRDGGATEIGVIKNLMGPRGSSMRSYYGPGASVREVTEMMEWFPYDMLVIATHCGDAPGHRWTYQYTDEVGIDRTYVVDIALQIERTDDPEMLKVGVFMKPISIDGIDWGDPDKESKIRPGFSLVEFLELTRDPIKGLQPIKKESVSRVRSSAALKLHDSNLLNVPRSLACNGTPIVISNACASWHRLAKQYVFSDARAYLGTLFPILPPEAHEIVVKLFDRHYGKAIPHALWAGQRDVYGKAIRKPYVVMGVYPQTLGVRRHNVFERAATRMQSALRAFKRFQTEPGMTEGGVRHATEAVAYYERELRAVRRVVAELAERNRRPKRQ